MIMNCVYVVRRSARTKMDKERLRLRKPQRDRIWRMNIQTRIKLLFPRPKLLIDLVFSWSFQDLLNRQLYKTQVSFNFLNEYRWLIS